MAASKQASKQASAWGQVHNLYWQFMAVASFSGYFLLPCGLYIADSIVGQFMNEIITKHHTVVMLRL